MDWSVTLANIVCCCVAVTPSGYLVATWCPHPLIIMSTSLESLAHFCLFFSSTRRGGGEDLRRKDVCQLQQPRHLGSHTRTSWRRGVTVVSCIALHCNVLPLPAVMPRTGIPLLLPRHVDTLHMTLLTIVRAPSCFFSVIFVCSTRE